MDRPETEPEHQRRQLLAAHARTAQRLAVLRLPMFGLPVGWVGDRHLTSCIVEHGSGTGSDGSSTTTFRHRIELAHESTDGAYLAVETTDSFGTVAAAALTGDLVAFAALRVRERDGRAEVSLPMPPDPADVAVLETTVLLGGRPTAFAMAQWRDVLVARWPGHAVTVTVRAERWPGMTRLALVRIGDPRAYLDGRRRRLEQAAGFRLA